MRNFRPNQSRHPLSGGEQNIHDEDELARISAGLRAARPAAPHELRERVRALRPPEPESKRQLRLARRIAALFVVAVAAAVSAVSMLQVAQVQSPSRAPQVLVAVDTSSGTSDGRRLVTAIDDTLAEEHTPLGSTSGRWTRDEPELVAIGSDGDVSARIGRWELDQWPRSSDSRWTSRYAHTLRAALTRPGSQSELGSVLNAAGRQLAAGSPNADSYLLIITDGVPTDSSTFERLSDSYRAMAARIRRLDATNVPDLRGVRVRLVSVRATSAGKPSPRAAARARLSLAWARATGATVGVN